MTEPRKNDLPVVCFAPPLTDELIDTYRTLISGLTASRLKDALIECLACCEKWWALPVSNRKGGALFSLKHRGEDKSLRVTPLEAEHVKELWDLVPWPDECDGIQKVFDELPSATPQEIALRNAAFHLLWHTKELSLDREPLTAEVLEG